jgi:hypothetical protein
MILKLILPVPEADRSIRRVSVLKWHKSEGDTVTYGDALCDVWVEEGQRLYRGAWRPDRVLGFLAKRSASRYIRSPKNVGLCITSSDVGVLRAICAREGTKVEVGGLLAMLTTEEGEYVGHPDGQSAEASTFRVLANVIQPNSGGIA